MLAFNNVLHTTEIIDKRSHDAFRPLVEDAFKERFAKTEHNALCTIPKYQADAAIAEKEGEQCKAGVHNEDG